MAKAAPAFQFYPEAFLAGTSGMSAAARGCYISMLASSWAIGPIEDAPRAIAAAMCLTPFDPPFEGLWAEIKRKWDLGPSGWTNAKLEEVRAEQERYRLLQSEKGKKGGRPKADEKPQVKPELLQGKAELKPEAKPGESPLPLTLNSDLDLQTLTSPTGEDLPAPAEIERHLSGEGEPLEIAAILSKPAFDRTNAENDALAKHRGVELLPLGSKPVRQSQASIAYREVTCRKHYGQGALPSCHRGICVPAFLGNDWELQCAGEADAAAYVRTFIADVCRGITGPVGDDPLKFWRAQWQAKHGSSLPREPRSNGERTVDAANRLVARYEREGRL